MIARMTTTTPTNTNNHDNQRRSTKRTTVMTKTTTVTSTLTSNITTTTHNNDDDDDDSSAQIPPKGRQMYVVLLILVLPCPGPRRARTRSEPGRMRRRPAIGTSSDTPCLGARRAPTRAVVGKDVAPTTRQTDRQTATTQEREEPLAHEGRGMTYRLSSSYPQSGPRGTAGEGSLGSQKGQWPRVAAGLA